MYGIVVKALSISHVWLLERVEKKLGSRGIQWDTLSVTLSDHYHSPYLAAHYPPSSSLSLFLSPTKFSLLYFILWLFPYTLCPFPALACSLVWTEVSVCSAKLPLWKWQTVIDGVSQSIHHPINTAEEQLWGCGKEKKKDTFKPQKLKCISCHCIVLIIIIAFLFLWFVLRTLWWGNECEIFI